MEMKALKDQLEAERQMWEANCAKKEVGSGKQRPAGTPGTAACGFPSCGLPWARSGFPGLAVQGWWWGWWTHRT